MTSKDNVTQLLHQWRSGDNEALERLMEVVYDDLHARAAAYIARERPGHILQPTSLVNEAFLRLVGQRDLPWPNRAFFFGVAARIMRSVLIDHARKQKAAKRGGSLQRVTLDENMGWTGPRELELTELDEALRRLEGMDRRQAKIVELRFFGGLSIEETAEVMNLSAATVKRQFRMARAWLHSELCG